MGAQVHDGMSFVSVGMLDIARELVAFVPARIARQTVQDLLRHPVGKKKSGKSAARAVDLVPICLLLIHSVWTSGLLQNVPE